MKTIDMTKSILATLVISLLMFSCTNKAATDQSVAATEATNHEEQQHGVMELNQGQKWLVNEEMKPFVIEAKEILETYVAINSSDYKTLATQLKEKNSGLIKSCTMKGESHDELHKWLHPYIQLLDKLSKAETKESAEEIIQEVQQSFQIYNSHFQ